MAGADGIDGFGESASYGYCMGHILVPEEQLSGMWLGTDSHAAVCIYKDSRRAPFPTPLMLPAAGAEDLRAV